MEQVGEAEPWAQVSPPGGRLSPVERTGKGRVVGGGATLPGLTLQLNCDKSISLSVSQLQRDDSVYSLGCFKI